MSKNEEILLSMKNLSSGMDRSLTINDFITQYPLDTVLFTIKLFHEEEFKTFINKHCHYE